MLELSCVVPLRSSSPQAELFEHLRVLAAAAEVIVVDGSDAEVFERHRSLCAGSAVRHVPVDERRRTPMGKVGGALTGVDLATNDRVVIVDDDVRYTVAQLQEVADLLDVADVVRPQNWFDPLPWHARWDTPRMLIGRATGGDWPGTMAFRRSVLIAAGGYSGEVMFENLELERTIVAAGGTVLVAYDLLVARRPPPVRQFLDQRVRQAYDEFARPARMAVALAIAPLVAVTGRRGAIVVAGMAVGLAEAGRRRGRGREVFPPTSALWAPLWVAERAVTSWIAVHRRLRRGGIRYRDVVLRDAATPRQVLQERVE